MDTQTPAEPDVRPSRFEVIRRTAQRLGVQILARLKQAEQTSRRMSAVVWARFSKASRRTQIAVAAAALAALVLVVWLASSLFTQTGPINVTAPVTRGNVDVTVLATGVLEPTRLVNVGAQASGRVQRLHVTLGQRVEEGALIAEIDATTQRNNVRTAEAQLRSARAQRAASAAGLNEAELHLRRQRQLLAADAISRADYESAEAAAVSLRAQVASLDAQIQQAQLALSTANANLGYTRITAPMAGTVVAIVTEEGQTVNAAQQAPTIVRLAELSTMTIKAEISEADVGRVAPGQTVYFTTLGDPDTRHYATLRAVEPGPTTIESEAQTSADQAVYYNGLFDVDNADGALRTGMTAQVYIVLGQVENVLTIPAAALGAQGRDGRYIVQVLSDSGRIEARQVRIGLNNSVLAEVQDGLAEGEEVVVAQSTEESAMQSRVRGGMMGGRPGGGGPPP